MFRKIMCLLLMLAMLAGSASALGDATVIDMAQERNISIQKAGANETADGVSPTTGRTLAEISAPENFSGMAVTGEYLPLMVQVPNEGVGAWFASYADVMYESAKSRGGDTRYTILFSDTIPEWVGPTRSVRVHHVFIREEWNVPYLYFGHQSNDGNTKGTDVSATIASLGWRKPETTNGISLFYDGLYPKEWSQYVNRVTQLANPNNAMFYTPGILENVVPKGEFTPVNHAYRFVDEAPEGGDDAGNVYILWNNTQQKNSTHNILMQYEDGQYYRYLLKNRSNPDAAEPVLDLQPSNITKVRTDNGTMLEARLNIGKGEQLAFSNVIVQYIPMEWYSNDEMLGTLTGTGNADVFMGGKHYRAVWNRDTLQERTVFYGEDGKELPMLKGKTMIFLIDYQNQLREVAYE